MGWTKLKRRLTEEEEVYLEVETYRVVVGVVVFVGRHADLFGMNNKVKRTALSYNRIISYNA